MAISTALGADALLLQELSFTEQLGRLFQMEVDLVSLDAQVEFEDLIGTNATVRLDLPNGKIRYFSGVISRFVQTNHEHRYGQYRATLVPWLWLLTRTSDCRIFQKKRVPDIIEEVFKAHGFCNYRLNLSGTYRELEYCVQYRETDFNFVSRLMEQEGIYYFFAHKDGEHTLVLADSASAHAPFGGYETIPYRPKRHTLDEGQETIIDWVIDKEVQPGTYALNDFNFKIPNVSLVSKAGISRKHEGADFEIFDYPGEYEKSVEGETYAKIRIEELHAQHEVLRGQTNVRGVGVGHRFVLDGHPRKDQNREYLTTAASYQISAGPFESVDGDGMGREFCSCSFTAQSIDEPFRSARITPKPLIHGPQTAFVVGPSGEELHTDKFGRVKVQFHWDRYGKADENSSCWVRVSQSAAGKRWGAFNLPRVGQEVIVEFLEGDPDRPIITGRVHNAAALPPYDLPNHATISTIKTNSSKGGFGFNEIRFEDKKGEEQIFVHAEKNHDVRIKSNAFEWVGHDRHLIVKHDQIEHVENNHHEIVDADHLEKVGKDRHSKIVGKQAIEIGGSHSMIVKGDVIEVFKGSHSEQTTDNLYLKASGVVIEALDGLTLKCGGSHLVINSSGVTIKGAKLTLDGAQVLIASGPGSPAALGQALAPVPPAIPLAAEPADNADPGEADQIKAEQRRKAKGKYGAVPLKAHKPNQDEEKKKSWIEIELVDEADDPVPGERYRITLPDGETLAEGTLDDKGFARIDGIEPGTCKITFPELDKEAWEPATAANGKSARRNQDGNGEWDKESDVSEDGDEDVTGEPPPEDSESGEDAVHDDASDGEMTADESGEEPEAAPADLLE